MATKEFLSPEDTINLENQAECLRDALLIHLLRKTGCRVSEILGIKISQVDFETKMVTIIHEKTRVKRNCPDCGERIAKRHKLCPNCGKSVLAIVAASLKEQEFRNLPLDQKSLDMIRDYVSRRDPKRAIDPDRIFNITRQCAWTVVKQCAEKAGLSGIINVKRQRVHHVSPHKLRDAFATNAANRDSSTDAMKRLQDHLGHKNFNTTMNYVRVSGEAHRDWFEEMVGEDDTQDEA